MLKRQKQKLQLYSGILTSSFVSIMVIIKFVGYYVSNSVSIFASFIDSGADFFSALISLVAITVSLKPADKKHNYGYEKASSIGALFEGLFILFGGLFLFSQSLIHFIFKKELHINIYSIIIMTISLMFTCALVLFQRYVYKKTNSLVIKANSVNYTGDILTTLAVLTSIGLTKYFKISNIDSIFGLLIALFLLKNATTLIKESIFILMDKEIDKNLKLKIKNLIRKYKKDNLIIDYHDLRTRFSGNTNYVEVHIEMDGNLKFKTAHDIAHRIKKDILMLNENIDITIHEDLEKITHADKR